MVGCLLASLVLLHNVHNLDHEAYFMHASSPMQEVTKSPNLKLYNMVLSEPLMMILQTLVTVDET